MGWVFRHCQWSRLHNVGNPIFSNNNKITRTTPLSLDKLHIRRKKHTQIRWKHGMAWHTFDKVHIRCKKKKPTFKMVFRHCQMAQWRTSHFVKLTISIEKERHTSLFLSKNNWITRTTTTQSTPWVYTHDVQWRLHLNAFQKLSNGTMTES